ncbi:MAG: tRNA (adenosine(37)-N6)-threonylcarbamoyltransferase complex ATPase subunit type 1 TsaE [Firmicutes bacterium]|nr:tRNA (adenosine(37)-N6)-threonylcarbamoyltransferase complex ATPase subunit type 1 TsaE [Bacillota bacterium]
MIRNEKEMNNFAKEFLKSISKQLKTGVVVLLSGDLGAGKTFFAAKLLKHLGVKEDVGSPTFVIKKDYQVKDIKVQHLDLYRIPSEAEAYELGFLEDAAENSLVLIEWPEVAKGLIKTLPKTVAVYALEIIKLGETTREVRVIKW